MGNHGKTWKIMGNMTKNDLELKNCTNPTQIQMETIHLGIVNQGCLFEEQPLVSCLFFRLILSLNTVFPRKIKWESIVYTWSSWWFSHKPQKKKKKKKREEPESKKVGPVKVWKMRQMFHFKAACVWRLILKSLTPRNSSYIASREFRSIFPPTRTIMMNQLSPSRDPHFRFIFHSSICTISISKGAIILF